MTETCYTSVPLCHHWPRSDDCTPASLYNITYVHNHYTFIQRSWWKHCLPLQPLCWIGRRKIIHIYISGDLHDDWFDTDYLLAALLRASAQWSTILIWVVCQFNNCCRALRSVTLNLANKFNQCTLSVAEHYDLFSGLVKRDGVELMTSYRTDRTEATEKLLQEKLNATTPSWN